MQDVVKGFLTGSVIEIFVSDAGVEFERDVFYAEFLIRPIQFFGRLGITADGVVVAAHYQKRFVFVYLFKILLFVNDGDHLEKVFIKPVRTREGTHRIGKVFIRFFLYTRNKTAVFQLFFVGVERHLFHKRGGRFRPLMPIADISHLSA